ncbi:NAD(P)/FAD-dependent oxidoreductase [Mycolicibacterium vaccae]|uniref:FAD dependent oxidoreductase n=1 Tax=Mycolicibacterium vaccae ATCC 25954 TaxID=1194972 RepID=K0UWE2_MYCVA|nr:FAD-dependent oxidoreductase [Mycolicibacterium vaccae]ANI41301.1 FAD dependent oxidoreductase [Mycolicibacterium vaccae 95051]EJZ11136.1 FAD dependent oxidoreductase [Mycolicibacterium vaccae ATCC 25954]
MKRGDISFWLTRPDAPAPPPTRTLHSDIDCDVAIVGGGLSGLWVAWALAQQRPELSIAVLEAERLGFGASGRNGGWMSAKQVGVRRALARGAGGAKAVTEMQDRLEQACVEVVDILGAQEIDARRGGWTQLARSVSELRRAENYVAESRRWNLDESSIRMMSAEETYERIHARGIMGAVHSPHNYCVDPVKMVFRLASLAMNAGAAVYTGARVTGITPGRLEVGPYGVKASQIVVATEGYTASQPGQRRRMLPLNSSMLVTEPLTSRQWDMVGWEHHDGVSATAHTYFHSERTPDGRIAIGGRGRPYRFASGTDQDGMVDEATVRSLMAVIDDLFPGLNAEPAHAWCGVIGVTRDWSPFLDYDSSARVLRMGGYAGQGLTASYLAGLAAADLLTDRKSFLSTSAWVRPVPRRWEPEPLRWIGANGFYVAYSLADRLEAASRSGKTSAIARIADKIAAR